MEIQAIERKLRVRVDPDDNARDAQALLDVLGEGEWLITVESAHPAVRDHRSFLGGYAPEDEGLYDEPA